DVLAPVVATRRRLLGSAWSRMPRAADVYEAHLTALRDGDDLAAEDHLGDYIPAAWCEADAAVQWTAVTRVVRYHVLRRPEVLPPRPALGIAMRRMVLVENAANLIPALLGAACVATAGALLARGAPVV